jgi:hypothetical protein
MTILWGGAHAVLGGCLIFSGDAIEKNLRPDDPAGGLAPVLWIMAGLMIVIGVVFLLLGVPGMLAGLGILWRKQWGRILAFIMAVPAIMVGLLTLSAYKQDAAGNATFGREKGDGVLFRRTGGIIHAARFSLARSRAARNKLLACRSTPA